MLGVLFLSLTQAESVKPIERVVTLLEDLKAKVFTEGKNEANTYNKFACFCKDTGAEKREAIGEGEKQKSVAESTINEAKVTRTDQEERKKAAAERIATLNQETKEERANRREAHRKYAEHVLDLGNAISAIEEAERLIKASDSGATLLSIKEKKRVKKAIFMAKALGSVTATSFLNAPFDPNTQDYDFHSNTVLNLLADLHEKLVGEKNDADEAEIAEKSAHDGLLQGKSDENEDQVLAEAAATKEIGEQTALIGQTQTQYSEVTAKLLDDQAYLKQLTANCNGKAAAWDQRTAARAAELTALQQALTIVKERVQTVGAKDKTVKLDLVKPARALDAKDEVSDMLKFVTHKQAGVLNFLQFNSHNAQARPHSRFLSASAMEKVATLLRNKGKHYSSASLLRLAAEASESASESGPFDKITNLIQELIERLQAEAGNDQDHNNWCKAETRKATQTRDLKVRDIKAFNQLLAKGEANRDQLNEDLKQLDKELTELRSNLENATNVRAEENAEYKTSVADAEEGRIAVSDAIDVLQKHYEAAAENKVSLVSEEQDPPEAGFKNDEAYQGSQDAAVGILGMLDVIKSDFVRQKDISERDERANLVEFNDFKATTNASIASKEKQEEDKNANLSREEKEIIANKDSLEDNQQLFDGAIKELLQLHEACVATGQTYEERVAAREDEIESLKEALKLLDQEGPVQTLEYK